MGGNIRKPEAQIRNEVLDEVRQRLEGFTARYRDDDGREVFAVDVGEIARIIEGLR